MLKQLLAIVVGVITLILGVMFSVILLALVSGLAVAALAFFWWKTRKLRKTMREEPPGGVTIEGEAVVVEDVPAPASHALPDERSRH